MFHWTLPSYKKSEGGYALGGPWGNTYLPYWWTIFFTPAVGNWAQRASNCALSVAIWFCLAVLWASIKGVPSISTLDLFNLFSYLCCFLLDTHCKKWKELWIWLTAACHQAFNFGTKWVKSSINLDCIDMGEWQLQRKLGEFSTASTCLIWPP